VARGGAARSAEQAPASRQAGRPAVADAPTAAVDLHRVQPGDTFSSLAEIYYGDAKHAQFLLDSNPQIGDATRLEVGAEIKIPPLSATAQASSTDARVVKTASPAQRSSNRRTYTVKAGDTFYGIARDVLGDASRWKELLAMNEALVKGDPTRLQVAQVIVLPE
jgi:nucleoid-associated protein YgaU